MVEPTTTGKLCLRDKALAKRSVNLFVRELDTAAAPAVRSNALVVLGDLCVRYCLSSCHVVGFVLLALGGRDNLKGGLLQFKPVRRMPVFCLFVGFSRIFVRGYAT